MFLLVSPGGPLHNFSSALLDPIVLLPGSSRCGPRCDLGLTNEDTDPLCGAPGFTTKGVTIGCLAVSAVGTPPSPRQRRAPRLEHRLQGGANQLATVDHDRPTALTAPTPVNHRRELEEKSSVRDEVLELVGFARFALANPEWRETDRFCIEVGGALSACRLPVAATRLTVYIRSSLSSRRPSGRK